MISKLAEVNEEVNGFGSKPAKQRGEKKEVAIEPTQG